MARQPNPSKSLEITVSLHEKAAWYLDQLMAKGLYGNSRPQAIATLFYDHCKMLIAQGHLEEAPRQILDQGRPG